MTEITYNSGQKVFLFGDQGCSRLSIYEAFGIEPPINKDSDNGNSGNAGSLGNGLEISLAKLPFSALSTAESQGSFRESISDIVEIYDFPDDRSVKQHCEVYLSLLGMPSLVVYFLSVDSSIREFLEWMEVFRNSGMITNSVRMLFVSGVKCYSERQQIIAKISPYFQKDVLGEIYFEKIETGSMYTCVANLGRVGIPMKEFVAEVGVYAQIKWAVKNWVERVRRPTTSVI